MISVDLVSSVCCLIRTRRWSSWRHRFNAKPSSRVAFSIEVRVRECFIERQSINSAPQSCDSLYLLSAARRPDARSTLPLGSEPTRSLHSSWRILWRRRIISSFVLTVSFFVALWNRRYPLYLVKGLGLILTFVVSIRKKITIKEKGGFQGRKIRPYLPVAIGDAIYFQWVVILVLSFFVASKYSRHTTWVEFVVDLFVWSCFTRWLKKYPERPRHCNIKVRTSIENGTTWTSNDRNKLKKNDNIPFDICK